MSHALDYNLRRPCVCEQLSAARPASDVAKQAIRHAARTVHGWIAHSQQRQALLELDDHFLQDIGVSRADAKAEALKRFWM